LQPKAAYWYSRRFVAPILVSFKPAGPCIEIWAINDTLSTIAAELVFEVLSFSGEGGLTQRMRVLIPANLSLRLAAPVFEELFQLDPRQQYVRAQLWKEGKLLAENRYFFCRYKHLKLETPRLDCRLKKIEAHTWRVQSKPIVSSESRTAGATLGATLTENYFDLDANGEMTIAIKDFPATQLLKVEDLLWKWLL
jgi:beta-mannosidase